MSFSAEIKKELCLVRDMPQECMRAMLYGLFFAAHDEEGVPVVQTDNPDIITALRSLTSECYPAVRVETKRLITHGGSLYTFRVKQGYDVIAADFGDYSSVSSFVTAGSDDISGAFLRGIFISCGSVTDPHKEYHLEIVLSDSHRADIIYSFILEHGMPIKRTIRSRNTGSLVLYAKGSELIEDFLTYIGAANHSLEIMRVKVEKDFRNYVNRHVNCESANLDKTVNAAQRIIEDIDFIYSIGEVAQLSSELQLTAQLRRDNPEMPLSELCLQFPEPISRSGLNHRLKKIAAIAQKLRNK